MTHGSKLGTFKDIVIKDHTEHGVIVLEQERMKGAPSQVWINSADVPEFIFELLKAWLGKK